MFRRAVARGKGAIGPATLLRIIHFADGTVHGFRSSFRDWAAAHDVPDRVAELCIVHRKMAAHFAAYYRTDLLEKRRPVMEAWGAYVAGDGGRERG